MKSRPSKADQRRALEADIERYLESGGQIERVARGVSGREDASAAPADSGFERPRQSRTPVDSVVRTIEARRQSTLARPPRTSRRKPRKKPIYDDFGEIIRWVWED